MRFLIRHSRLLCLCVAVVLAAVGCEPEPDRRSVAATSSADSTSATPIDSSETASSAHQTAPGDSTATTSKSGQDSSSASNLTDAAESPPLDTAAVECPVGPEHGDATIELDSTDGSVQVKPDSSLTAALEERWGSHWDYFGGRKARVNADEHPDLIIDVGTTLLSKNVKTYTDIFVGCGSNRYAVVGERLLFDRFGTWDDGEEKWKTIYTRHEVGGRDPPLTYTKKHRFYHEQEEYLIIPGSVWYTEKSEERLGFDYKDRPSCPAGERHPPVKLRPEREGKAISEGDIVRRYPQEDTLYVYWTGMINSDKEKDLVLGYKKGSSKLKYIYAKCKREFYVEVYRDVVSSIKKIDKKNSLK